MRHALIWLINLIFGAIEFLIGARILLRLFSANPATPVVAWIYDITNSLLSPVSAIFPNLALGPGVFDVVALVGLLFYAVVSYLIILLIRALFPPPTVIL